MRAEDNMRETKTIIWKEREENRVSNTGEDKKYLNQESSGTINFFIL
jgi:hypothetical protein